jgi:hypothetical protein
LFFIVSFTLPKLFCSLRKNNACRKIRIK